MARGPKIISNKESYVEEDIPTELVSALNGLFDTGNVAYILGKDESPTDLIDFVSTECALLDVAISNRLAGGIACGRITELNGLEGSGKSLIAAHLMAAVQKEGGVAVLLDTENAVNQDFFKAIGLNMSKMVYAQPECVEDIFVMIESIVDTIRRKHGNSKKVIIVVDSIAAAPTKKELEGDYDKDGYATDKAIILSKAFRKIKQLIAQQKIALVFTNQLRQKLNAMPFSDPWTTSGGKSLAYYASTRIRLSVVGKINNKDKEVVGITVKAAVIKNRLGPPFRSTEFKIYFDRGIDDLESWLDYCKSRGIITSAGPSLTYTDVQGIVHKIPSKSWKSYLSEHVELREEIANKMAEHMIMSYSTGDASTLSGELEESDAAE